MAKRHPKSVLCVDDETIIRDTIVDSLSKAGYTVYCTDDSKAAYDYFTDMRPFLVLMDLVMPKEVNGIILADRMRMYNSLCAFVAITGYLPSFSIGGIREVFDDFFLKPIGYDTLKKIADCAYNRVIRWEQELKDTGIIVCNEDDGYYD